ncbi:L-serine dehydratase [Fistulifera solaris]|uniref:L-serine ammonia-lyase n=1 Tax=Fistulifera solaris TaxID=1519565 RepID=A0A1Z5JBS4_FISSO|nr:L-serine dehydratase [Fistulifera solaris]|eukprot:GAX11437.1 L-serine dehydratase [Fistulifera solaris]
MSGPYTTASSARAAGLFYETPLLRSVPLSSLCGRDVYLKMDGLQASGSFKDRGMAHLCLELKETGVQRLVSSSGGNAGLAVATVGARLGIPVDVIVPQTTKPMVIAKLQSLGASVTVHGENWNAADEYTREKVTQSTEKTAYISPYDNPLLWTGHSTLVDEICEQLHNVEPAALIVSVGGGGLLCGALEGIQRNGWKSTTVVAAETEGAASFGKAWTEGIERLSSIDSIATSLGALQVTPVALQRSKDHGSVTSIRCTDAEAVDACWNMAQDHRILVEPACGAALATLYSERLRNSWLANLPEGPIVVEVCGGSGVNMDLLTQWKTEFLQ